MSKRWSLTVFNDWKYVGRDVVDVAVVRIGFDWLRGHYLSFDFIVCGLGLCLSRFVLPITPVESLGRNREPEA